MNIPKMPSPNSLPTPDRGYSNDLRSIEQPKRMLYRFLRESFDKGALKPGGKVVVLT